MGRTVKKVKDAGITIAHCTIQMGPTAKPPVTDEVARAVMQVAAALTAQAKAAEALAYSLRGPDQHYHGSGISISASPSVEGDPI